MRQPVPFSPVDHWEEIQQLIRAEVSKYAQQLGTVKSVEGEQVRVRLQSDEDGAAATFKLYDLATPLVPVVGDMVALDRLGGGKLVVIGTIPIVGGSMPLIYRGTNPPNGITSASTGSLYIRDNGEVWRKSAGSGNNQSWYLLGAPLPDIVAPPGLALGGGNSAFTSNSSYAIYLGRTDKEPSTITIRCEVMVAAATITWAEVAICTSASFVVPSSVDLTTRGFTSVSASFNSTGEKTVAVSVNNIVPGNHLWLVVGSQATTPFQLQSALGGDLSASQIQNASSTRPSTMVANRPFTSMFNNVGFYALATVA